MSVLIVTSLGDIVVDLFSDRCPLTTKNFLKLCKIKYYNGCLFHNVQKNFTAQTGDPTGTGSGGDSIYKYLYGDQARFFGDEIHLDLKHAKTGTIAMASAGENLNASQFYITLRDDLDYLDGKHTVFGEIAEGLETLARINESYVDENHRPYKNIRIKHTYILDDPFDDPLQLSDLIPGASPEGKPKDEVDDNVRLEDDWVPMDEQLAPGELEERLRAKDARSSAVVLETIGDIPDVEIKPPDNVLFVCKLNPVTEDEDLFTIFSRFGVVQAADIIRDFKTGDSLCYAFIEFETKEACEQAYFKMDNALIDDRRIHVDFSQSVARLWSQYRRKDAGKGKGCFKCGALDHIAKDCTGDSANIQQPQKYILKNDNAQRGGGNNSSYEMVFPEDTPESPRPKKRHQGHGPDDIVEKQKMYTQSSEDQRQDRDHRSVRDKRYKEESNRDGRSSRSGGRSHRDNLESGRDIEKVRQKDTEDSTYVERSREEGHRKRSADSVRERQKDGLRHRDDDDYYSRNRTRDDERTAERRRDGGQTIRSADSDRVKHKDRLRDRDDDRTKERSTDREYRSAVNGSPSDKRDDEVYKKRHVEHDRHAESRDDRDYRRKSVDDDRRKRDVPVHKKSTGKEDREHRR